MPESELARKVTKFIKTVDKLVRDIRKNANEMLKAVKELEKKGDEDDTGKG